MDRPNIFSALRADHDKQRRLLDQLVKTTGGGAEERKRVYLKLKKELNDHAKLEERFFYKPLMSSALTQEKSRHSMVSGKLTIQENFY